MAALAQPSFSTKRDEADQLKPATQSLVYDGSPQDEYQWGYKDGYQDVQLKNRCITRLDLGTLYCREYAQGYRDGSKEARREKLTNAQRVMLVMQRKDQKPPFDPLGSFAIR